MSLSGNFLTISEKSFASIATDPSFSTVADIGEDFIPISRSLPVSVRFVLSAVRSIHSSTGRVVRELTALETIFILSIRASLLSNNSSRGC